MPITFRIDNTDKQIVSFKKIQEIQQFISQRFDGPVHVLIVSEAIGEDYIIPPYVDIDGGSAPKIKKLPHYKTLENKRNLKRDSFK